MARIKAGVRIGTRVELDCEGDGTRLSRGDRGVVVGIAQSGLLVIAWDRGLTLEIEPEVTALRPLG